MNQIVSNQFEAFMSVRQVASYLQLNEKKIYALINEGGIPATKVTGKWMFPKELIDKWMLDSTHSGLLRDRLLIAGGEDPLLYRVVLGSIESMQGKALISYSPTSVRTGLKLLNSGRVDGCCVHWGPLSESHRRHPSLLQQYPRHAQWVLIRLFEREQGLTFDASRCGEISDASQLIKSNLRWALRQEGSGSQRFLMELLSKNGTNTSLLNHSITALSERQAAAAVAQNTADIAFGSRATAIEHNLDFISIGWEGFDLVISRDIWFRRLFQTMLDNLKQTAAETINLTQCGYRMDSSGDMIWGDD